VGALPPKGVFWEKVFLICNKQTSSKASVAILCLIENRNLNGVPKNRDKLSQRSLTGVTKAGITIFFVVSLRSTSFISRKDAKKRKGAK
jgi:hypothetical protein